jgi:hypothetical protein
MQFSEVCLQGGKEISLVLIMVEKEIQMDIYI